MSDDTSTLSRWSRLKREANAKKSADKNKATPNAQAAEESTLATDYAEAAVIDSDPLVASTIGTEASVEPRNNRKYR